MRFADIPAGAAVFVDSNTIIYHFISHPSYGPSCTTLLERIERKEIEGWTSPHVLAEVAHRLMTIEACLVFGWSYQGIATRLRRHPMEVQQLVRSQQAMAQIVTLGFREMSIENRHVVEAGAVSCQHGLLTNDALLVALMRDHGLVNLASKDADFDRIPAITRFAPT